MVQDLWRPPSQLPDKTTLPGLRERADFIFDLTLQRLYRNPAVAERVSSELVERSRAIARALAEEEPLRLLHGDLHPGNVLRGSGTRGLVAIDPRPCLGDPGFDAVDWLLADGGGEPAVHSRIHWLASRTDGLDPDRAWTWCQALAVVLAVGLFIGDLDARAGKDIHAIAQAAA